MTKPKWTQEEAIAFECARECITDLMGICSTEIADEEESQEPDLKKIYNLEKEMAQLAHERANLTLTDHDHIAAIRTEYGARIRAYRQKPSQSE